MLEMTMFEFDILAQIKIEKSYCLMTLHWYGYRYIQRPIPKFFWACQASPINDMPITWQL